MGAGWRGSTYEGGGAGWMNLMWLDNGLLLESEGENGGGMVAEDERRECFIYY